MNYQQSSNFPIMLSFDGGATFKELVCVIDYTAPLTLSTTDTDTLSCGRLVGVGAVAFDFNGEGVTDLEPDADQVSLVDLESQIIAHATGAGPIIARVAYPGSGSSGALYFKQGYVFVVTATKKASANDLIKFDFELKGQGIPDIIAP